MGIDLHTVFKDVISNDLEWLSKIFSDTSIARSLCDSWASYYIGRLLFSRLPYRETIACGCLGGDGQLCLHGREWTTKPQRPATCDGDRTNVSRPASGDDRLRHSSHAQTHASAARWHSHRRVTRHCHYYSSFALSLNINPFSSISCDLERKKFRAFFSVFVSQ